MSVLSSNMEHPAHSAIPLFNIPAEIFKAVTDYLSKRDILCLSLTCRGLKEAPIVLETIYTELFDRDDLPLSTYKEYTANHKPMFDTLLNGITTGAGSYVRHVSAHEWLTKADISLLLKYCPNLDSIDFTGISEGINWSRYVFGRNLTGSSCFCPQNFGGMNPCVPCRDQFEWHDIILSCPQLFRNLKAIELTLLSQREFYDPTKTGVDNARMTLMGVQLPKILSLATNLQTLRLQYSPPGPGLGRCKTGVDEWQIGCTASGILLENILSCVSPALTKLELHGFRVIIPHLNFFLEALECLPNLRKVVLSVHQDMMSHTLSWYLFYQNCLPIYAPAALRTSEEQLKMKDSVVQYVRMLRSISERQRWDLVCADNGERYPMGTRAFYGFLDDDNLELLRWLRARLNWTPVFQWSEYTATNNWDLVGHLMSLDEEMIQCRKLFKALKGMKIPIKLIIPAFWDGTIFTPTKGSRYRDGRRSAGHNEATTNLCNWRLNSIGDLVDELSLRWGYSFGDMGVYTMKDDETVAQHFKRRKPRMKAHLSRELKQFIKLCKTLAANFPNLTRLALFLPAMIYPNSPTRNNDAYFAAVALPGTGWRVQHHGSGGAMPYNTLDIEHEFGLRHPMRYSMQSNCDSVQNPFEAPAYKKSKEIWLAAQTHCPMIHRVFARELPAS